MKIRRVEQITPCVLPALTGFTSSKTRSVLNLSALIVSISLLGPSTRGEAGTKARAVAQDSASIPEVEMNEYLFTSEQQFADIESFGASTCVIVTLFDPLTHLAAMAHISSSIAVSRSLDAILSEFAARGVPSPRLQARMVGGWKNWSDKTVSEIDRNLAAAKVRVLERDVLSFVSITSNDEDLLPTTPVSQNGAQSSIKSVILSLRTGILYDYTEAVPAQPDERAWGAGERVFMPKALHRHRLSLPALSIQ